MTIHSPVTARTIPQGWDRSGLPGWTYHSKAMFDLERAEVFLKHWLIAGHVCDLPAPGDWLTFDILGERALIIRGTDSVVRAFHNLCRHRGARLADGPSGHCRSAMVCPFHGWVYNLDGTLRGAARPESFGEMDRREFGLKPIEMEVWHGFIFVRFQPGAQGPVRDLLQPYDQDLTEYRAEDLLPAKRSNWTASLPVNWKSVRDVDNEGYHVAFAHPGLQELYGHTYADTYHQNGLASAVGTYGHVPGRSWSVRNYIKHSPVQDWLPEHLRRAWTYYGVFPNAVIAFTPESAQFYHDIPVSETETIVTGRTYRRSHESRETRLARYLAMRIDRETSAEDQQLQIWSNESMKSTAFDGFHLSDHEYGVRHHHEQLRKILPVMTRTVRPPEDRIAPLNEELLRERVTQL